MGIEEYSVAEIESGIEERAQGYRCLLCGEEFCRGEVYPMEGRFFDATHAVARHVEAVHGPRLEGLLEGSDSLGLTEKQKKLMRMIAAGMSDAQIAAESGVTPATVRSQRFVFREKAKQARVYLAAYGLMEQAKKAAQLKAEREDKTMQVGKYTMAAQEYERYVANAFYTTQPLKLRAIPAREKRCAVVIDKIAAQFRLGVDYTEKQVNTILEAIEEGEYVVLRRYLVEYGYLGRERDGSRYWLEKESAAAALAGTTAGQGA